MVTLDAIYKVMAAAVRYGSSGLNTFAVIRDLVDVNTPNLNKVKEDYNKPYFYSRSWEHSDYNVSKLGFEYPALLVIEVSRWYDMSQSGPTRIRVNLEISAVEQYKKGRLVPELYRDTSHMLVYVLNYMKDVKAYSDGTNIYYLHTEHAKWLRDTENLTLTELIPETSSYLDSIQYLFKNDISGGPVNYGSDDLYGSFIRGRVWEYVDGCKAEDLNYYQYADHLKDLSCGCK